MNYYRCLLLFVAGYVMMCCTGTLRAQTAAGSGSQPIRLSLQEAIRIASDSSLTAFRYRNMYRSGYWEYVSYRAARLPSLTLNLTPARYNRYIAERYDSERDMDVYREQQTYSATGGLSIVQNVDFLGGTLYMDSQLDYLNNFGFTDYTQFSSIPLRIGYRQSLLGYNAFRWERKIAPLKFERVKKEFIYNLESLSGTVVGYFFALVLAQAKLELAETNLQTSDTLCRVGEMRYKIAAISQADLLTLQLDVVNARNSLQHAQQEYRRAMFVLSSYLGLEQGTRILPVLPERPKVTDVAPEQALALARANNPTYLQQYQNVLEAQRNVDKTRKELYMNASINASIGFNQVGENFREAYHRLLQQDLVSVSVSIPLVDWGVRKGKSNMARNNLYVVQTAARQEELNVEQEVTMTVDDFHAQRILIESAEKAVELADLAYEQTRQRFLIGQSDVNSLTMAQSRKETARQNYVAALNNYWQNYYKLRKLTLFDFEHNLPLFESFDFQSGCYGFGRYE